MAKGGRIAGVGDKINLNRMIRDVLMQAISKGQLPLALFGIWIIIVLLRLPASDLSKLVSQVLDLVVRGYLVGDVLAALFLAGWFIHVRAQRRLFTREMQRVSEERNEWQKKLMGDKIISSEEE